MAGRPKGSRDKRKAFRNALRMELAAAGGDDALRDIVKRLIEHATEGDIAAIREVADRLDGRPREALDMSGGLALSHEEALAQLE